MTPVRKYRQWVAGLLLIAYTFIAVPVSLWHSHSGPANTELSSTTEGFKIIAKASESNSSHNCKICSHKYSVYADDAIKSDAKAIIPLSDFNSSYTSLLFETPSFNLSNKSPPVQG